MNQTFDAMMKAIGFDRIEDKNVEAVRQKLLDRSNVGIVKYGCTTERKDLSIEDWINHLQMELMDAAVYCQALLNSVKCIHDDKGKK